MSLRRISILLNKEFFHGSRNYIFVVTIVGPILISLVISLIFGTWLTEKPRLGIVDEGQSQLVTLSQQLPSVITNEYGTVSELKQAVESGSVDIGIVLPTGFDNIVVSGETVEVVAYVWGESLAKNRTILGVTITNLVREMAGQEAPIEIEEINLGGEVSVPWSERMLPFIVIMAVFFGGLLLPASSVINEKEKKTLDALVITPTSIEEVFASKGLLGVILSLVMGIVILILNQAFGTQPLLLILLLVLGAIMAGAVGLLCGALVKDITTLFAVWKSGGILLFGPAFIYMFPQIPQWIGGIFPTYYLLQPIVDISQRSGNWSDIALNVFILIGLDVILIGVVLLVLRRTKQFASV